MNVFRKPLATSLNLQSKKTHFFFFSSPSYKPADLEQVNVWPFCFKGNYPIVKIAADQLSVDGLTY